MAMCQHDPQSPSLLASSSPVPHPSLSRDLQSHEFQPYLIHELHELDESQSSVLSLAASDRYIFSGNQSNNISVWDKNIFGLKETLRGHTGSVLALEYAKSKEWLFSSSGDSTIRVWSTTNLTPIYVIDPYLETGAGDLFSIAWSNRLQTIYIGCQNTSLQWFEFSSLGHQGVDPASGTVTPTQGARKAHKFFDSYPQYQRKPADLLAKNGTSLTGSDMDVPRLEILASNVIDSAHYGYIYCMGILEDFDTDMINIVTGGGDETIKLWGCTKAGPVLVHTFEFEDSKGAIYSLIAQRETIYAGCQDGHVKVIDAETRTLVRTIIVQEGVDILSLSMVNSDLYACLANGQIQRYSASFDCTASWPGHNGIVLSSIMTLRDSASDMQLITGANDGHIKVWDLILPLGEPRELQFGDDIGKDSQEACSRLTGGPIAYALSKFVSIPSISKGPSNREDCRQAAIWLKKCLTQLGASASLLSTGEGTNPLVFGTFTGTRGQNAKPRILFYGHYDIISAPREGWNSDPFTLTGKNGYLYGRGVTDNKGPILATACAAAELLYRRALGVDLIFLVEGEEECGSTGFEDAVRKYKDLIGPIDAILVSNSTWIGEETPCITYGLRGVIHCSVKISSDLPDLHSGIEGGAIAEPMLDMVNLLATLVDKERHVQIPTFYDRVRSETAEEKELYARLAEITKKPASSLSSRWREPSLTVHTIEISGPKNATVIPGTVKAQISLRIVPDQCLETIVSALREHLESSFERLSSPNNLKLSINHSADWWLGNLDDHWFKCLESAVREEWGAEPLRIREGGSIPSVPYLEKEFGCHALHLPMGQSSDQAHLPNERISLQNLQRGRAVVERFLQKVSEAESSQK